jgi:hypothetical protein
VWNQETHFSSRAEAASNSPTSDNVRDLDLPQVLTAPKGYSSKFAYESAHYARFAVKLKKMNPDVDLDKDQMDEAFRAAMVVGVSPGKGANHDSKWLEAMMKRVSKLRSAEERGVRCNSKLAEVLQCLGRVPDYYWNDR